MKCIGEECKYYYETYCLADVKCPVAVKIDKSDCTLKEGEKQND